MSPAILPVSRPSRCRTRKPVRARRRQIQWVRDRGWRWRTALRLKAKRNVVVKTRNAIWIAQEVGSGSKCEELKVRKASLQYPNDQTLFGRCEKFRRRATRRHTS